MPTSGKSLPHKGKASASVSSASSRQANNIDIAALTKRGPGRPRTRASQDGPVALKAPADSGISPAARMKAAVEQFKHAQTRHIDLAADSGFRPLTGMDVDNFRARHQLLISDIVHMLALPSGSQYNVVVRGERAPTPLPYIREFLVRICDRYPSPPPWRYVTMREAFEQLYGASLQPFEGTPQADAARVMAYARFTALLGRSSFSAYRWIEKAGRSKPELSRALAKVLERPNPRQAAEDIARIIWGVRGVDFEKTFPMPSLDNISLVRRRGRSPDARISRVTRFSSRGNE